MRSLYLLLSGLKFLEHDVTIKSIQFIKGDGEYEQSRVSRADCQEGQAA
jgi:hypothetical protein